MINWQVMKDNVVGKLIYLFLMFSVYTSVYAGVVLRAVDDDGETIEQVQIGHPFTLEVIITDLGQTVPPAIEGVSQLVIRRTGYQMHTINGVSSLKYSYLARIDQPGSYTVGPARVTAQAGQYSSNQLTLEATEYDPLAVQQNQSDPIFLRCIVDKDSVVVGERINCSLRFYYDRSMLGLKDIGQQNISGFDRKNIQGPRQGTEVVDGKQYQIAEWTWQWYPRTPGAYTIPAHYADFEITDRRNTARTWGGFFNAGKTTKRAYSNALNINVGALPAYPHEVTAVGRFEHVKASISPALAKQGEGMVLTIEFEGDGDLEALRVPIVRGMPQELKYYDSKTTIEPASGSNLPTKKFEFIVQGLKAGNFEIPQQKFVVFDTESRLYKELQTVPLFVTIAPSNAFAQVDHEEPTSMATEQKQQGKHSVLPLHEEGPWTQRPERKAMTVSFFIIFLLLPVVASFSRRAGHWFLAIQSRRNPAAVQKKAFVIARSELQIARKKMDIAELNRLFVRLYAHRKQKEIPQVSLDDITREIDEVFRGAWLTFATKIAATSFGGHVLNAQEKERLFDEAAGWIKKLEGIL
jgi:hypothetical protein